MKKNIILCLIVTIFLTLFIIYQYQQKNNNPDAINFKEEYEMLNGQKNAKGKDIRTVNIDKNNPIRYVTEEDIVEKINNKETFVVYFGFATCPWCRSIITNLLQVAKDLKIKTVYYVDILEIRDTLTINNEGKIIKEKEGTVSYLQLVNIFKDMLSDYTLKDDNNQEIKTGEKRIYAPNIISVVKGTPQALTTGISKKQNDAYMELTEDMNKESYNLIKCTIQCVANQKNICSAKSNC